MGRSVSGKLLSGMGSNSTAQVGMTPVVATIRRWKLKVRCVGTLMASWGTSSYILSTIENSGAQTDGTYLLYTAFAAEV
jgi:hypothetical protein